MEDRVKRVEERLENLEKQEREYVFTIRDTAHKTTIALGILTAQEVDIKEIKAVQVEHGHKLDSLDQKVGSLDQKMDQIIALLAPRSEE